MYVYCIYQQKIQLKLVYHLHPKNQFLKTAKDANLINERTSGIKMRKIRKNGELKFGMHV